MYIAVAIVAIVFLLIAVRQVGSVRLSMWQIMLGGAVAMLLLRQISITQALLAINVDVMLFLAGMFVLGAALEASGYLHYIGHALFNRAKSVDVLVLFILFGAGIASAFVMNDTIAIVGTPLVLLLARQHRLNAKLLLLTLAFAITIGSVMSPIGNPQNLLIALEGSIENPFVTFLHYLFLPTILNLIVAYLLLKLFFKKDFGVQLQHAFPARITNHTLARLCIVSITLIALLIAAKVLGVFFGWQYVIPMTALAVAAAVPVLLSKSRGEVLRKTDWKTLVFFAAMFIVMEAVWNSGFLQMVLASFSSNVLSLAMIFVVSVLFSQLISNVPLVALYLPMLLVAGATTTHLIALAAASTIAGNLLILGAASNIIIIQQAEERGETITFLEFAKIGIPLTALNVAVYLLFL
jgi:Na+/H+ antiporter NhaD/arsenite permease-like protein